VVTDKSQVSIDGVDYESLSDKGKSLKDKLDFVNQHIRTLFNQQALLNKAKNAYIEEIKHEIVLERAGVDLKNLICDD
tara:strand:+ start:80 stop:313 length:234 start_codon:yes stop_codon:yes gene_type:complete